MNLKRTLDRYKGHRTFILICVIVLPFLVKGLLATAGDLSTIATFISEIVRDAAGSMAARDVLDGPHGQSVRKAVASQRIVLDLLQLQLLLIELREGDRHRRVVRDGLEEASHFVGVGQAPIRRDVRVERGA